MSRSGTSFWAAVLLGTVTAACSSKGSGSAAPEDNVLTLWEERPAPPVGTSIGVYVQATAAPAGTLVLESREARICALSGQGSEQTADAAASAPDAGPSSCPFEQRFTTAGGTERFSVILMPLSTSVPPLLAASLENEMGNVVATVLRRFYPVAPAPDAAAAPDHAPATDSSDAAVTDSGAGQ